MTKKEFTAFANTETEGIEEALMVKHVIELPNGQFYTNLYYVVGNNDEEGTATLALTDPSDPNVDDEWSMGIGISALRYEDISPYKVEWDE